MSELQLFSSSHVSDPMLFSRFLVSILQISAIFMLMENFISYVPEVY